LGRSEATHASKYIPEARDHFPTLCGTIIFAALHKIPPGLGRQRAPVLLGLSERPSKPTQNPALALVAAHPPIGVTAESGIDEITTKKKGSAQWAEKMNVSGGNIHLNAELEPTAK
jgi:hypothetical protein